MSKGVRVVTQELDWETWVAEGTPGRPPNKRSRTFLIFNEAGRGLFSPVRSFGARVALLISRPTVEMSSY